MPPVLEGERNKRELKIYRGPTARKIKISPTRKKFRACIAIDTVSSLPRWRMARAFFFRKMQPGSSKSRRPPDLVSGARFARSKDAQFIPAGRFDPADYLLRDFADFEVGGFRLPIARALLCTAVYLLSNFCAGALCIYKVLRFRKRSMIYLRSQICIRKQWEIYPLYLGNSL